MKLHETIFRVFKRVFGFRFKVEVETLDGWIEVRTLNITHP